MIDVVACVSEPDRGNHASNDLFFSVCVCYVVLFFRCIESIGALAQNRTPTNIMNHYYNARAYDEHTIQHTLARALTHNNI